MGFGYYVERVLPKEKSLIKVYHLQGQDRREAIRRLDLFFYADDEKAMKILEKALEFDKEVPQKELLGFRALFPKLTDYKKEVLKYKYFRKKLFNYLLLGDLEEDFGWSLDVEFARSRGRGRKVPISVAVYGDIKPKEVEKVLPIAIKNFSLEDFLRRKFLLKQKKVLLKQKKEGERKTIIIHVDENTYLKLLEISQSLDLPLSRVAKVLGLTNFSLKPRKVSL